MKTRRELEYARHTEEGSWAKESNGRFKTLFRKKCCLPCEMVLKCVGLNSVLNEQHHEYQIYFWIFNKDEKLIT